jgi:hypothetical protein
MQIYAVGGFNGSMRVRTVDIYDTGKDQWLNGASMNARRSTLGVATLGGRIYAVGGFDGSVGELFTNISHKTYILQDSIRVKHSIPASVNGRW